MSGAGRTDEFAARGRMVSALIPGCKVGSCDCYGAHDPRGRKDERRKAKRRERQAWRRSVAAFFGSSGGES